jgi:iron(III) transport system substrate-binding protein
MNKKKIAAALLGILSLSAVTACGGAGGSNGANQPGDSQALVIGDETIADGGLYTSAKEEGTLTLYDNYPEGPWRKILDVFTEDTGIDVEHVRLVTPQLYERVVSEAGAGRLQADAIGMGDVTLMQDMAQRGILGAYESPIATKALSPEQHDPKFKWYSAANLVMVPSYNEAIVGKKDLPQKWEDFLDPQWKGKLGATPITTGGSAFTVYHFMRQNFGENYWKALAANSPKMYESVTPLTQDLVRGEVPLGITSLGTIADQRKKGAPVAPLFLDEGTPAFTNMVGVTEKGEHPNAAKVYLNWLLSLKGQSTIVDVTSEFPVRKDAPSPSIAGVEVPSLDSGKIIVPPFEAWTTSRDTLTKEWNADFR